MKGHSKGVTCLDIEHSGSRMVTGSMDYTMRMYDFNGMKSDVRAFRCVGWNGGLCAGDSWQAGDSLRGICTSADASVHGCMIRGTFSTPRCCAS